MDPRCYLNIFTLLLLAYCYWQTYVLGRRIRGGVIGRHWGAIRGVILMMMVGNTMPFWVRYVSPEAATWIESIILFVSALAALMAILFIQKLLQSTRT